MPCYVEEPLMKWETYLEWMLCQSCRLLTREQMEAIENNSGYIGLFQWYKEHLLRDFGENYENEKEREKYQKEANRIGRKLIKEQFGYSCSELEKAEELAGRIIE